MNECAVALHVPLANIEARVREYIEPVYAYFVSRVLGMLAEDVEILRICRLANPIAFKRLTPTALNIRSDIEQLGHFTTAEIDGMINEPSCLYTVQL